MTTQQTVALRRRAEDAEALVVEVRRMIAEIVESRNRNDAAFRDSLEEYRNKLAEARAENARLRDALRGYRRLFPTPGTSCDHALCAASRNADAALREGEAAVWATLDAAREQVQPRIELERQGEIIGADILNMPLREAYVECRVLKDGVLGPVVRVPVGNEPIDDHDEIMRQQATREEGPEGGLDPGGELDNEDGPPPPEPANAD